MQSVLEKNVLTTGEVARICHVAPRTVSKWFDSGKLRGYRIPGSRDRRIPVDQLVAFMRAHEMPFEPAAGGLCRMLIVDPDVPDELTRALNDSGRYRVRTAGSDFAAGLQAEQFRPQVVVLAVDGQNAGDLCRQIKAAPALQAARVLAAVAETTARSARKLKAMGFDHCIARPYSLAELVRAVEEATDLIT